MAAENQVIQGKQYFPSFLFVWSRLPENGARPFDTIIALELISRSWLDQVSLIIRYAHGGLDVIVWCSQCDVSRIEHPRPGKHDRVLDYGIIGKGVAITGPAFEHVLFITVYRC